MSGYEISVSGPISTVGAFGADTSAEAQPIDTGYGLIIQNSENEFLIAAGN